ncbi:hypothetical protein PTQ27_04765 [Mannheimia sp. AT1]|uniref:Uncharacterized protein n=1 Tax=Mannheimia cairinae TaxID=3025936 RepID=A0ABT5MNM0_9PAST|nr:hypothetical protein [Mannheimia cairinae]MDD0823785.1 hypothetical protein [Mannheimia cairinae]MDD0825101.1 hypothetical protein [Mannheimia cairinae]
METVKLQCKGFVENYCITFSEDKNFYTGFKKDGIYDYFRNGKEISGYIEKPTGKDKFEIKLESSYKVIWEDFDEDKKFYIVKI